MTVLTHELCDCEKRLQLGFCCSIDTMKANADLIRRIHVRVRVPDPLDKPCAVSRKRYRQLALEQTAHFLLVAPRSTTVRFLIEHDACLFHQAQLRRRLPKHAVPHQIVVVPPVVQRREIDLSREELHVGTVGKSILVLAHSDQLFYVAVASNGGGHLTNPTNEPVLREES